jgi:nitroreductase
LSNAHRDWRVIDEASSAAEKPKTAGKRYGYGTRPFIEREIPTRAAAAIIRGRRSALAYDRRASVPKNVFFGMLDRTVPRSGCAPFDAGAGELSVDLLLFVHRVSGLEPGLYFLVRDERSLDDLRQRCDSAFLWERAADPPEALPLYLLRIGDCREQAERVSCHQEIAGDGVFAVAMIARFRENVAERPFLYRCLHWEAGMIGQVFYLEAEAHELRGTGMGCFFDDPVHEILGLRDNVYQDIYHFAVGKAVEDRRLTTLPPYHHLKGERNE